MGPVGVWSFALQRLSAQAEGDAVRELEGLGFRATWIPESVGSKEVFAHSAILLGATKRLVIAPGIANIYARDPMAMANAARALGEAHPGRFMLGIGVSHKPSVETRGSEYGKPVETMRRYLDGMAAAQYAAPGPDPPVPLVLAALGPRMLELAAERTDGAHPYFVPVDHTTEARRVIGPDAFLGVEQTAVLTTDRAAGLRIARAFAKHYLEMANYANNLRRLGWSDEDLAGEGTERLIDAIIAVGDVETIAKRVRDHLDSGADHVCVQLREESSSDPALGAYRELAAAFASELGP
jgi:probable F420-dependent oxidoreductase